MRPLQKIKNIKKDLIRLCGEDDPAVKAVELKELYLKISAEFERIRNFKNYEVSIQFVCQKFHVSRGTAKRAISYSRDMVHKFER